MNRLDSEYYIAREKAELALARASANPAVAGIHRELAARYAHLVRREAMFDCLDGDNCNSVRLGGLEETPCLTLWEDRRLMAGDPADTAVLSGLGILIVEDDPCVASELAFSVECLDGRLIGPVATVAEALALVETESIAAAILDASLLDREVTPLALRLIERSVPFVVHTGTGLPAALSACFPDLPLVMKPASPPAVLAALSQQIFDSRRRRADQNAAANELMKIHECDGRP
jgi:ActR/RegA family two-component response regulator